MEINVDGLCVSQCITKKFSFAELLLMMRNIKFKDMIVKLIKNGKLVPSIVTAKLIIIYIKLCFTSLP